MGQDKRRIRETNNCPICGLDIEPDDLVLRTEEVVRLSPSGYDIQTDEKGRPLCDLEELPFHRECIRRQKLAKICRRCGKQAADVVLHHLSYEKGAVVPMCRSCHTALHKSEGFSILKPRDKRPIRTSPTASCLSCGTVVRRKEAKYCRRCERKMLKDASRPTRLMPEMRACPKCGHQFDGRHRTTCPKCRTFFRQEGLGSEKKPR